MGRREHHVARMPTSETKHRHRQSDAEPGATDHHTAARDRTHPAAVLAVAARAGVDERARAIERMQQVHGNAHVARLIQRAADDKTGGDAPAVAFGSLQLTLFVALLAPGAADPDALIAPIDAASVADRRIAYHNDPLRGLIIGQLAGTDRERVIAALLSGTTYHPGTLSILYNEGGLSEAERHGVDTAVNARFLNETGIGRPLDWENDADKPLARRWLQLRDVVMDEVYGQPERQKDYEAYLQEAIGLLRGVEYGRSTGDVVGEDPDDRYDLDYWEEVQDQDVKDQTGEDTGMLRLKPGASPSMAIDELFAKLDQWAFDCAEFVQVAHLYAQRHTLGDLAFDRMLTDDAGKAKLLLRSHGSTGLLSRVLYQRDSPHEQMRDFYTEQDVDKTIDDLLAEAPVGSRITWRNLAAPKTSDYYNENAIKMGDNQYAAQGLNPADELGPVNSNIFTRDELELALARITSHMGEPDRTEIEANVFVRSIQHYLVP